MPRGRKKQASQSNHMDVDTESEDEQVSVSQVSKSMKRVNVSQNARKGKAKARQLGSDSDEEEQESRNTQRTNGTQSQRGRPSARQIDSGSDEEPQPSTSQASQKKRKKNATQSQRAHHSSQPSTSRAGNTMIGEEMSASQISPNTSLTEQDFNHHVANTVKYILSADLSNHPIDRSRISNAIDCHNKRFKDVFKSAQDVLKDVFGLEMVDIVEEKKDGEQEKGAKQPKSTKFILVNTINTEDMDKDFEQETSTRYFLLFICLTHIYMSGDKCTKESLRSFLKRLGIVRENSGARHEQFNDAMETVEKSFVAERYIAKSKEEEFTWGVRAIQELKPREVMEFISKMYGGRSLDSWPQEYERLLAKEQQQNQRPNGEVDDANQ